MISKLSKRIVLLLAVSIIISCEYYTNENNVLASPFEIPPFVVTKPVCEIKERPGYFTYAGIVFQFMNTTNKVIEEILVSFMLFDVRTNATPFFGNNRFQITMLGFVQPNENRSIILSLDRHIFIAPEVPYLIDFFYISKIKYTDGSIWEDKYGLYIVN